MLHFVSLDDIDPLFFDKPYYISPGETSLKAYYTLLNALEITNKVGIANVFLYSKQQMAIIRSVGGSLVLHTMHFEEELRSVTDVPNLSSTSSINESDTQVTVELIDKLSTSFNPSIYKNNYRDALQNVIQQKNKSRRSYKRQRKRRTRYSTFNGNVKSEHRSFYFTPDKINSREKNFILKKESIKKLTKKFVSFHLQQKS